MLYEIDWQAAMFELDDLPVIHSQQPQTHLKELSLTVVEKDDQLQPALSQLLRSMQVWQSLPGLIIVGRCATF